MKRLVYIGDYGGKTIYFDSHQKVILKSKKTLLNSSEKTKDSARNVVVILIVLMVSQPILRASLIHLNVVDARVGMIPFFVLLGYILIAIGLTWLVHIALYGNSSEVELASKQEFRHAVSTNNFGKYMGVSTSTKKFLWVKIKTAFVMVCGLMVGFLTLGLPIIVFDYNMSVTDMISGVMAGMGPALIVILIWLNNIFRWILIVEKFAKNDIVWGSKAIEYEKKLKEKRLEIQNGK